MPDVRSEIRDAFERRLARAPMNPELPGRVAERVARRGQRHPLRLATAVAVLLALTVVVTLVFLRENRGLQPRPATTPPITAPSTAPTQTPTPAATAPATPTATPMLGQEEPRITTYRLPDQTRGVSGMAWGPDGALWFTMQDSAAGVWRLDASGAVHQFALPTGTVSPAGITVGPDGALWIAAAGSPSTHGAILRLTTDGHFTSIALTSPNSVVQGITAGPDGALWFTELSGNRIGRITTSGVITEYALPTDQGPVQCGWRCPRDIVAGPDGALWFTESQFSVGGGNKIGRITIAGVVTEYTVPTPNSLPGSIVRGPDGSLWFTEDRGGRVGRVTTAGHVTELPVPDAQASGTTQAVAAGSDGGVWAVGAPARTDLSSPSDRLYRVAPDGTITEHRLPGSGMAMTPGAAGTLWVAGLGQLYEVEL